MKYRQASMKKAQLMAAIDKAVRYPHKHVHKGELILSSSVFTESERETNLTISPFSLIDCTGSIKIGPWTTISARTRIYTHDHCYKGLNPLTIIQEDHGVVWQDKMIGSDVWINDGSIVLFQVTHIPDGVVLGAGSVLTKNPEPFEIWAGNPARKIGERQQASEEEVKSYYEEKRFRLDE